MMNLIRINGNIYNLDRYNCIRWDNSSNCLELWEAGIEGDGPYKETGPEAAAAWEWLQVACIWKMDKTPGSAK